MKNTLAILSLLMVIFSLNASARKPAVEPVSGVEPESYNATSRGVEVRFNFGNHIYVNKKPIVSQNSPTVDSSQWVAGVTLIAFIVLPFLMWFGINKTTQGQVPSQTVAKTEVKNPTQTYADTISQENVTSLSDHRTDHEDKDDKKKVA